MICGAPSVNKGFHNSPREAICQDPKNNHAESQTGPTDKSQALAQHEVLRDNRCIFWWWWGEGWGFVCKLGWKQNLLYKNSKYPSLIMTQAFLCVWEKGYKTHESALKNVNLKSLIWVFLKIWKWADYKYKNHYLGNLQGEGQGVTLSREQEEKNTTRKAID